MSSSTIADSLARLSAVLAERPEKARAKNAVATATLLDGVRCEVTGPGGERYVTDMPPAMGGQASGPNPGWLLRAGLAACNATCIATRAAQLGITLTQLDVTVSSESDVRGMLGLGDVPAGLQDLRVRVRISAPGRPASELEELVRWACARSPVGCTDPRSAAIDVQVEA